MDLPNPPVESQSSAVVSARPVAWPLPTRSANPLGRMDCTRGQAALDLALVLMVALVMPFGFDLAAAALVDTRLDASLSAVIPIRKGFDALLLLVLAAYFVYRQRVPPAALGLQAESLGRQALWSVPAVCGVYVVFIAMMLAITALVVMVPGLERDLLRRTEFLELLPVYDLGSTILLLIPVAIHEELLFRSLLIPYLHRLGCGWIAAVLISSAIFASLHIDQGMLGIVQVFGVGVMLGVFFVLSRSLLAVAIAHFLFNFVQFQLARFVMPWVEQFAQRVTDGGA